MSVGFIVPGNEIDPDWRAVLVGAAVLGALCAVAVLAGWIVMPGDPSGPEVARGGGPGIGTSLVPFVIGAPGPLVAGYLARRTSRAR